MKRVLFAALLAASPVLAETSMSPEGAKVYFANIEDGATLSSPVEIQFGLDGMKVAPAGTEMESSGHHHILVDRPPLGEGEDGADELLYSLPADENHVHFGKGQTAVVLDLSPGEHTLQLVLGDHNHIPHDPPVVSEVITITVQ
ncbi:DUF4399 domain-containing protein [Tropicimonas sp. TH_r6]|uniref:DUF4399 domain-containing protein n=1 Tax=Tropicimonas sp. TH_r6 TaxID=3082085 RepID=UPI0029532016|nr:DUF4399 domain-containing protein [Tropicimonas sp. TH_r6]MDV7142047.1 DUF4399 domain-containing protein [Tropicimonas sp. TH_r6]